MHPEGAESMEVCYGYKQVLTKLVWLVTALDVMLTEMKDKMAPPCQSANSVCLHGQADCYFSSGDRKVSSTTTPEAVASLPYGVM